MAAGMVAGMAAEALKRFRSVLELNKYNRDSLVSSHYTTTDLCYQIINVNATCDLSLSKFNIFPSCNYYQNNHTILYVQ